MKKMTDTELMKLVDKKVIVVFKNKYLGVKYEYGTLKYDDGFGLRYEYDFNHSKPKFFYIDDIMFKATDVKEIVEVPKKKKKKKK